MKPPQYLKSIVGAVVAALGTLSGALADNGVTAQEWITVIVTFLVTAGAVFTVPNAQPDPAAPSPPVWPPSPGNPPLGH